MLGIPPFILACALIVVGYYFFSSVLVRRMKEVFLGYISIAATQNELMRQSLIVTTVAFKTYASKHQDPDFLTEKNFTKGDLEIINTILSIEF